MEISDFKMVGVPSAPKVSLPDGSVPPANLPLTAEHEARISAPNGEAEPAAATDAAPSATAAVEAAPQEEDKSQKVDPKFSLLARKEAALHRQREQLKAEKASIEAAAKQAAEFESAKAMAKDNPMKLLELVGLTYDNLTEHVMNSKNPVNAEVQAVKQEIERLRQENMEAQARAERAAQEKLEAESQAVIESFRQNAEKFVLSNASKYEWTIAQDQISLVYEVIEEDFKQRGGGEVMSFDKAADLVEQYLEKRQEQIAATKKFQARYGQKQTTTVEQATQPATTPAPKRPSTLSNAMTASTPAQAPKARTEQDRVRAALARLEGR